MDKITFDNRMMVAAHRGDSYNYYENTMEAFRMTVCKIQCADKGY